MCATHYAMLANAQGAIKVAEFSCYESGRAWVIKNHKNFRGMLGVYSAKTVDAPHPQSKEIPRQQIMALFGAQDGAP